MKLIDADYQNRLSSGIISLAHKLGYNTSLYEAGNENVVIGDYGSLAYKAWEDGIISESSYLGFIKDLGVDISKLDEIQSGGNF